MHSPMGIHDVGVHSMYANSSDARKANFASLNDTLQMVQGVFTLLLNLAVFLLIILQPKLKRKKSHQLFLNLQLSHMLMSVLIIVSELYSSTWEEFYLLVVIGNALLIEMFFSLIVCSADRFIAINFPFKHRELTIKHIVITITCSWIAPVVFASLSLTLHIVQHYMTIIMTVMIGVATCTLAVSNLMVYITAIKHDIFVRRNSCMSTAGRGKDRKMLKASYVCLGIVSSFVFCWLPYFIHNTLTLMGAYRPGSKNVFTVVSEQLALLNSLLDPLLFLLLSRDARSVILKVLKGKRNRSESNRSSNSILLSNSRKDTGCEASMVLCERITADPTV